jgi:predicted DNA-binding mobile mystery protein A
MRSISDKALARARINYRRSCLLRVSAELERWRQVAATRSVSLTHPHLGWIRYLRDALHMSGFQLAQRLGVRQPTAARLEQKEREGTITVRALRRVAHALGCELVYALIPRATLKDIMDEQVARAAAAAAAKTAQQETTMDAEELERELLVRMPGWIWGSWEYPELYGAAAAQRAQGGEPKRPSTS